MNRGLSLTGRALTASVLIVYLLPFSSPAHAEGSDAYDFPIRPGMPAWATLKTHDDMLAATQVPTAILHAMSTEGLVETCLAYPLLFEIDLYSSPQGGFEAVSARFNGLQELLRRSDAGALLMQRYRNTSPMMSEGWGAKQRGQHAAIIDHIELILAQYAVLRSADSSLRLELLAECLRKAEVKRTLPNSFGFAGLERTAFLAGRILEVQRLIDSTHIALNPMRAKAHAFLRSGVSADATLVDAILLAARSVLQLPASRG